MIVIVPDIALDEINSLGEDFSDKIFSILKKVENEGILKIPPTRRKNYKMKFGNSAQQARMA